jgi:alcohol dehydrogenase (cytochrome c)
MRHVLLLLMLSCAAAPAQHSTRENWPYYGGGLSAWRHSELEQVNTGNVRKLVPVWAFQTGINDGGLQSTPIVIDGIVYLSSSWNRVFAIDGATGRELWHYFYQNPREIGVGYSPWNRGVAVDGERVFMGTLDNSVVALERRTGRELWKVNVENIRQCGCNITGAPLVARGKVIVGVTGGDSAHRGYITAFDARTGRKAWRFWTIPAPGEKGSETWDKDSWKFGGGSTWMTGSYDPDLNLVYWGVGNPAADFYGASRRGANLYTDSVVALDADTGTLRWYYQQIPHDVWDWDTAYECVLLDLPVNGKMRKLLLNVNKGGYTFVIDRTNGEFVSAWPVADNINWISGVSPKGELLGRNEPELGKTTSICPCIAGGRSWNHGAFSPVTGWYYSTGHEWCQDVTPREEEPSEGKDFFGGVFTLKPPPSGKPGSHLDAYDPVSGKRMWRYEAKYPLLASILSTAGGLVFTGDPEGQFFALNTRTGEKLWSFPTGSGHRGSSVTYAIKGRQYVLTPSGWGSSVAGLMSQLWPEAESFRSGSSLFAFALPEDTK